MGQLYKQLPRHPPRPLHKVPSLPLLLAEPSENRFLGLAIHRTSRFSSICARQSTLGNMWILLWGAPAFTIVWPCHTIIHFSCFWAKPSKAHFLTIYLVTRRHSNRTKRHQKIEEKLFFHKQPDDENQNGKKGGAGCPKRRAGNIRISQGRGGVGHFPAQKRKSKPAEAASQTSATRPPLQRSVLLRDFQMLRD